MLGYFKRIFNLKFPRLSVGLIWLGASVTWEMVHQLEQCFQAVQKCTDVPRSEHVRSCQEIWLKDDTVCYIMTIETKQEVDYY